MEEEKTDVTENRQENPDEAVSEETPESTGEETETKAEGGENPAEEETDTLKKKIEGLTAELKESKDNLLRAAAEYDNSRKRMRQDFETRVKYASLSLGEGFIAGLDNFERALEHVRNQKQSIAPEQIDEFVKGIEMIYQQFLKNLEDNGYKRIQAKGEPFNPEMHEAMGMIESEEVEPGQVANVFKAGYLLHERVVRPAMVQVAKEPEQDSAENGE